MVLLRLSVLLHRSRSERELPPLGLLPDGSGLKISLPSGWLAVHPLTGADLEEERRRLRKIEIELTIA